MAHSESNLPNLWLILGGAACLAGVWFSVATLRTTPAHIAQIEDKVDQIQELQDLDDSTGEHGARELFEQLGSPRLPSVADVADELVPDADLSIQEGESTGLDDGWILRTTQVSGGRLPIGKVLGLVAALECERPPWRLQAVTIDPDADTPGLAAVTLTLTGLHREKL